KGLGERSEHTGKAAFYFALLGPVACTEQDVTNLCRRPGRHLLDTNDQNRASGMRFDGVDARMNRRRTSGAGVLDACGRHLTETFDSQRWKRRLKVLLLEAVVHGAEIDGVNIFGRHAGMSERLLCHLGNQGLRLAVTLAEFAVRPTCDANGHRAFLCSVAFGQPPSKGRARA